MELDITATQDGINFAPASEAEEIAQNVRMILTTPKMTVPMDRGFEISGEISDLPVAAAQAKLTAEIVAGINTYEPRAKVVSVDYEGAEQDGTISPKVRIIINDET